MPVSEKKKASNAKWNSKNLSTLGCSVRKEQAAAFKAYCEVQGKTSNTVLKDYVLRCIGDGQIERDTFPQPVGAPVRAANPMEGILSTDTLRAAQKAAKATGEDMPAFMARAVDRAVRTDEAAWSIGVNPATGKEEKKGGNQWQDKTQ